MTSTMTEVPIASHLKIRYYLLRLIREAGSQVKRIPPERLIAEKLSVSRGTVRKAIQQLIAEGHLVSRHGLGTYIDPSSWYSLCQARSERIRLALVIGDGMAAYYSPSSGKMLGGFAETFSELNTDFTLVNFNDCEYSFDALTVSGPAGLLWIRPPLSAAPFLQELVARDFPVVSVDSPLTTVGIVNISTDFMEIGRMAAKHLIKLGHRRILQASLLNGSNSVIEKECRDGFVEVMRNAGMPFGNEFEISSMDQQIEGDFSAAFIAHECFLGPLRDFVRSEQRAKKMDVVVFSNALQSDSTMKVHTIVSPIKKLAEQSTRLLIDKITSDCDTAGYVLLKPEILSSPAK